MKNLMQNCWKLCKSFRLNLWFELTYKNWNTTTEKNHSQMSTRENISDHRNLSNVYILNVCFEIINCKVCDMLRLFPSRCQSVIRSRSWSWFSVSRRMLRTSSALKTFVSLWSRPRGLHSSTILGLPRGVPKFDEEDHKVKPFSGRKKKIIINIHNNKLGN
jgi:hypothetical protein